MRAMLLVLLLAAIPAAAQDPPAAPPLIDIPDSLAWPTVVDDDGKVVAETAEITRRKLTLQEIIERSIVGEATKLAGHHDLTSTTVLRVGLYWKDRREIEETIFRDYNDADGNSRQVQLAQRSRYLKREGDAWVPDEDQEDAGPARIEVSSDGFEDFADVPFFLEEAHEFDFELVNRTLRGDHVIFEIAFRPRSDFKPLPSGRVWVDTTNYRIIHEEYAMEKNPFPLFLKEISHISRSWEQLPTGEWVFTRMLFEVKLRNVTFGLMPQRTAIAVHRKDFEFDAGYDARLFGEGP